MSQTNLIPTNQITIKDLVSEDRKIEIVKLDQLNQLLNLDPPKQFIKNHPFAKIEDATGKKIPLPYIPIDKVEHLLTRVYQTYQIEVKSVQQLFHSVQVTVRLHYNCPVTGRALFQDGVGAMNVQTDSGASAADLGAIKANAVMLAVPAAKSYAIKDAAEHLGKLFGRDISRKDTIAFKSSYSTPEALNASAVSIPETN